MLVVAAQLLLRAGAEGCSQAWFSPIELANSRPMRSGLLPVNSGAAFLLRTEMLRLQVVAPLFLQRFRERARLGPGEAYDFGPFGGAAPGS